MITSQSACRIVRVIRKAAGFVSRMVRRVVLKTKVRRISILTKISIKCFFVESSRAISGCYIQKYSRLGFKHTRSNHLLLSIRIIYNRNCNCKVAVKTSTARKVRL
jgi:hypothetical protein